MLLKLIIIFLSNALVCSSYAQPKNALHRSVRTNFLGKAFSFEFQTGIPEQDASIKGLKSITCRDSATSRIIKRVCYNIDGLLTDSIINIRKTDIDFKAHFEYENKKISKSSYSYYKNAPCPNGICQSIYLITLSDTIQWNYEYKEVEGIMYIYRKLINFPVDTLVQKGRTVINPVFKDTLREYHIDISLDGLWFNKAFFLQYTKVDSLQDSSKNWLYTIHDIYDPTYILGKVFARNKNKQVLENLIYGNDGIRIKEVYLYDGIEDNLTLRKINYFYDNPTFKNLSTGIPTTIIQYKSVNNGLNFEPYKKIICPDVNNDYTQKIQFFNSNKQVISEISQKQDLDYNSNLVSNFQYDKNGLIKRIKFYMGNLLDTTYLYEYEYY
jgi:hypothetical protein